MQYGIGCLNTVYRTYHDCGEDEVQLVDTPVFPRAHVAQHSSAHSNDLGSQSDDRSANQTVEQVTSLTLNKLIDLLYSQTSSNDSIYVLSKSESFLFASSSNQRLRGATEHVCSQANALIEV